MSPSSQGLEGPAAPGGGQCSTWTTSSALFTVYISASALWAFLLLLQLAYGSQVARGQPRAGPQLEWPADGEQAQGLIATCHPPPISAWCLQLSGIKNPKEMF